MSERFEVDAAEAVGLVEVGVAADGGPGEPVGVFAAIGTLEEVGVPGLAGERIEGTKMIFKNVDGEGVLD